MFVHVFMYESNRLIHVCLFEKCVGASCIETFSMHDMKYSTLKVAFLCEITPKSLKGGVHITKISLNGVHNPCNQDVTQRRCPYQAFLAPNLHDQVLLSPLANFFSRGSALRANLPNTWQKYILRLSTISTSAWQRDVKKCFLQIFSLKRKQRNEWHTRPL